MIKVAFCDDETKILEDLSVKIKKEFEKINCEIDLYTTENSIRLLEYLKSCPVDILFLDIDMPTISGMDIAEALLITGVVKGLVEEIQKSSDTFLFKTNDGFNRIKLKDILYFESESNYLNLHTANTVYKFRSTISAIEKELSAKGFIRTHKGFLVNQEHIFSVKSENIVLSNNVVLPIGRTNRDVIKARIMRYMR